MVWKSRSRPKSEVHDDGHTSASSAALNGSYLMSGRAGDSGQNSDSRNRPVAVVHCQAASGRFRLTAVFQFFSANV